MADRMYEGGPVAKAGRPGQIAARVKEARVEVAKVPKASVGLKAVSRKRASGVAIPKPPANRGAR